MSGANRSLFQLIRELKEDYNVETVVLAPPSDASFGTIQVALKEIGVPVIETPIWYFKLENPTVRNVLGYVRFLWKKRHLADVLRRYHFDIIHSNTSVIDIGGYLSRKLGIKHVWHFREFGDSDYNLHPIGGLAYERYTYNHADAYIAISKAIANHFKDKVTSQKIHTIYNGIYLSDDQPISNHDNSTIQFLCAGFISPVKNQKEIVHAVDELVNVRQIPYLFHLTLVGNQEQQYVEELKSLIRDKKLNKYIDIMGEVNGIHSLAAKMDVGIMSSRSEAFGRVTIEYQMQNLLVIANNAGANPELIQDGVTGLLYEKGNYKALADKMQWAIEHSLSLREMAQKGKEHAHQFFTSKRNTKEIYDLYHKLID